MIRRFTGRLLEGTVNGETREYTGPGFHIWFGESFWKDDPSCRGRSRELTPLYLTRYQAARGEGQLVLSQTWEFSCTLAGRGTLRSSHNIDLEPATIYLIPPGFWHAEASHTVLESIWMGLCGDRLPESAAWDGPRSVRSPEIAQLFEQSWFLAQRHKACVGAELDGLARAILGGVLRLLEEPRVHRNTQLVQEAIRLMYATFASPLTMTTLAKQLECSSGHLHRVFRRVAGTSPGRYLTRIRMEHAIMWLQGSDLPVAEVAMKVGYQDPLYFSRAVRQTFGCSPSQIRLESARGGARR